MAGAGPEAEVRAGDAAGRSGSTVSDVFAGAGMGLLTGTLVGLSSAPVVGVVVGALASALAVFLGLDAAAGTPLGSVRVNGARVGSLGLAMVAGLGLGLWVRVSNPFLPDPAVQLARWQAALPGDPTLAKQMVVLERTGIAPASFRYGAGPPAQDIAVAAGEGAETRTAVLFSTLSDFDPCLRLDPARLASPRDVLRLYGRSDAPAFLPALAERIAALPEAEQATAVAIVHETLCLMQREEAP